MRISSLVQTKLNFISIWRWPTVAVTNSYGRPSFPIIITWPLFMHRSIQVWTDADRIEFILNFSKLNSAAELLPVSLVL